MARPRRRRSAILEVDWSEVEAVSSPAEGPTAKGSQLPMAWTIAHPGEVVAIREVGDAKERRPARAEATVELVVDHAVRVVVDAGPQATSAFDERDFDSGSGESVRRDTASRPAAHDTHIEYFVCHHYLGVINPPSLSASLTNRRGNRMA